MTPSIPDEMRAGRILGPNRTEVATVPVPTPGPGEVLIEVARAGICGTDLHILDGDYELARFPMTPGHEFAGTIVALGEGVRLRRVGERVTADPTSPAASAPSASAGRQPVPRPGRRRRQPATAPSPVTSPSRSAWWSRSATSPSPRAPWSSRSPASSGASSASAFAPATIALVFGAGPMGCLLLQALKASGAAASPSSTSPPRGWRWRASLGADLAVTPDDIGRLRAFAPLGFELVVEATGIPSVLEGCIEHARPGGTVWVFGVAPGDAMAKRLALPAVPPRPGPGRLLRRQPDGAARRRHDPRGRREGRAARVARAAHRGRSPRACAWRSTTPIG
jgi:D-arabinitol dehydrogenase (NADP+)